MKNTVDKETRQVFIDEMARTRGWEILREEILDRRKRAVKRLVNGDPSNVNMEDVIVNRARIKLIDSILASVDDYREENYE